MKWSHQYFSFPLKCESIILSSNLIEVFVSFLIACPIWFGIQILFLTFCARILKILNRKLFTFKTLHVSWWAQINLSFILRYILNSRQPGLSGLSFHVQIFIFSLRLQLDICSLWQDWSSYKFSRALVNPFESHFKSKAIWFEFIVISCDGFPVWIG